MVLFRRRKSKQPTRQPRRSTVESLPTTRYYRPKKSLPETKVVQNTDSETNKKFTISRVLNIGIMVAIIGLLLFSTTMSSSPNVELKASDFAYRPVSEYEAAASTFLKDSPLQRSKLFFRSQNIEQAMLEEFPEISQIDAIVPLGGRDLGIVMRVAEPFATLQNGAERGVIDDDGVLIIADVDEASLLAIRYAQPQADFEQGSRQLTVNEIALLQLLERELAQLTLASVPDGLQIASVLFNLNDGQFEVSLTNAPYGIKLSTYSDTQLQVGAVKATLSQLDEQGGMPTQYLDVRVPGRVFVL